MERAELADLLGVSNTPTTGEIRVARKQVARRFHPDQAGADGAAVMAELNDACDRWIAEIRSARDAPTVSMPASFVQQPDHERPAPDGNGTLAGVYVLATIALMAVIMAVVVVAAGPSATSLAVGALVGAAGGAVYLVILRAVTRT